MDFRVALILEVLKFYCLTPLNELQYITKIIQAKYEREWAIFKGRSTKKIKFSERTKSRLVEIVLLMWFWGTRKLVRSSSE